MHPKRKRRNTNKGNDKMVTQNQKEFGKSSEVMPGLKAGIVAVGKVIRITTGKAIDFMSDEQCRNRRVREEVDFVEIEVIEPESKIIFSKSFQDYGNNVPAGSIMGKLLAMYGTLKEDMDINIMTKEVEKDNKFVVYDFVLP